MNILDMFRGTPSPQQQQQVQQVKEQQQQVPQQTNGFPVEPANPAAKAEEVSGLAKFEDLWQTPVKKEGEPEGFDPNKLFDLDPAKLQQGLQNFNPTQGIKAEDLAAIQAGGEEATQALLRVLNASNQATLAAAIQATGGMTSSAFARAMPSLDGKINSTVRSQQVSSHLNSESPLMKNEATRPLLTAMATQFASKHPDASPQEIVAMVNDYMVTVSESMGMSRPGTQTAAPTKASEEKDWGQWFQQ